MKITKSYLKQLIKEEIYKLKEVKKALSKKVEKTPLKLVVTNNGYSTVFDLYKKDEYEPLSREQICSMLRVEYLEDSSYQESESFYRSILFKFNVEPSENMTEMTEQIKNILEKKGFIVSVEKKDDYL